MIFKKFSHTSDAVIDTLASFLRSNPSWCSEFVAQAISSPIDVNQRSSARHQTSSLAEDPTLNSIFLEAIVRNVESSPHRWLSSEVKFTSGFNTPLSSPKASASTPKGQSTQSSPVAGRTSGAVSIPPACLLVASLLLQGSDSMTVRGLALRLGEQLRVRFDPGYEVTGLVHPSVDVSFAAALKQSAAVAQNSFKDLGLVMEYVAEFATKISLSDTALLLRLVRPWLAMFGDLLVSLPTQSQPASGSSGDRVGRMSWPILSTVFKLTRSLGDSPLFDPLSCDLWQACVECDGDDEQYISPEEPRHEPIVNQFQSMNSAREYEGLASMASIHDLESKDDKHSPVHSSKQKVVIDAIVSYLIFEFTEASYEQILCQRISQHVFRSRLCHLFVNALLRELPRFDHGMYFTTDDLKPRLRKLHRRGPAITKPTSANPPMFTTAIARLSMLCDMIYERPSLFRAEYPLLLQSAVALRADVVQQLLLFVAVDLGFDQQLIAPSLALNDVPVATLKRFANVLNKDKVCPHNSINVNDVCIHGLGRINARWPSLGQSWH